MYNICVKERSPRKEKVQHMLYVNAKCQQTHVQLTGAVDIEFCRVFELSSC